MPCVASAGNISTGYSARHDLNQVLKGRKDTSFLTKIFTVVDIYLTLTD